MRSAPHGRGGQRFRQDQRGRRLAGTQRQHGNGNGNGNGHGNGGPGPRPIAPAADPGSAPAKAAAANPCTVASPLVPQLALTGKVGLIVGVANKRSIAWAIAQAAAAEGASLVLTYQSERLAENVRELAATLERVTCPAVRRDRRRAD